MIYRWMHWMTDGVEWWRLNSFTKYVLMHHDGLSKPTREGG
jgi:hypothetical protein